MVHAAMASLQPGEVLVLDDARAARRWRCSATCSPRRRRSRGAAAVLVDAAVRDSEELAEMGLPVWARWIRSRGATKDVVGELDVPVVVGGSEIRPGDLVVLDADGVDRRRRVERAEEVLEASLAREAKEAVKREQLQAGALSYELDGLRAVVEA